MFAIALLSTGVAGFAAHWLQAQQAATGGTGGAFVWVLSFAVLSTTLLLAWLTLSAVRWYKELGRGALRAGEQVARVELARAYVARGKFDEGLRLLERPTWSSPQSDEHTEAAG